MAHRLEILGGTHIREALAQAVATVIVPGVRVPAALKPGEQRSPGEGTFVIAAPPWTPAPTTGERRRARHPQT